MRFTTFKALNSYMRYFVVFFFMLLSVSSFAQETNPTLKVSGTIVNDSNDQPLSYANIINVNKTHLNIYLSKFWLPVCPQILIPETSGNLKIFIKTGYHQYLFKKLWRLWERIKHAWIKPAWHDKIPCALRGIFGKKRCFKFKKTVRLEIIPCYFVYPAPCCKNLLHFRSSHIEISVFQSQRFIGLFLVKLERKRFACI